MKIFIWTHGDPSVGINGESCTIDYPDIENLFDVFEDGRETVRKILIVAFSDIMDEKANVMFEDEED